jgi:hypothetical protein
VKAMTLASTGAATEAEACHWRCHSWSAMRPCREGQ